jgi:hypothetical protein
MLISQDWYVQYSREAGIYIELARPERQTLIGENGPRENNGLKPKALKFPEIETLPKSVAMNHLKASPVSV